MALNKTIKKAFAVVIREFQVEGRRLKIIARDLTTFGQVYVTIFITAALAAAFLRSWEWFLVPFSNLLLMRIIVSPPDTLKRKLLNRDRQVASLQERTRHMSKIKRFLLLTGIAKEGPGNAYAGMSIKMTRGGLAVSVSLMTTLVGGIYLQNLWVSLVAFAALCAIFVLMISADN